MTNPVRTGCAACLVLAALGLAACGTVIDDGKAEDAVQASVEKDLNVNVKSVDCPSDVDVEPKKTFDCQVTAVNGDKSTATLKILNDDADVAFVGYKKSK
jgi:hypothetical protein